MREILAFLKQDFTDLKWESYAQLPIRSRRILLSAIVVLIVLLILGMLSFLGVFASLEKRKLLREAASQKNQRLERAVNKIQNIYQDFGSSVDSIGNEDELQTEMGKFDQWQESGLSADILAALEALAQEYHLQIIELTPLSPTLLSDTELSLESEDGQAGYQVSLHSCGDGLNHFLFLTTLMRSPAIVRLGEFRLSKDHSQCVSGQELFSGVLTFFQSTENHNALFEGSRQFVFEERIKLLSQNWQEEQQLAELASNVASIGRNPFTAAPIYQESQALLELKSEGSAEAFGGHLLFESVENSHLLRLGESMEGHTFVGTLTQDEVRFVLIKEPSGTLELIREGELFASGLRLLRVESDLLTLGEERF